MRDPCVRCYIARLLARVGEIDGALELLRQSIGGGFFCRVILERDPWLDRLRGTAVFDHIAREAAVGQAAAARRFARAGGDVLLGVPG